jgi:hypothetical protein
MMVADGMYTNLFDFIHHMKREGKRFTVTIFNADMKILCDEKVIVSHWADGMLLAESDEETLTFLALAPGFTIQINGVDQ